MRIPGLYVRSRIRPTSEPLDDSCTSLGLDRLPGVRPWPADSLSGNKRSRESRTRCLSPQSLPSRHEIEGNGDRGCLCAFAASPGHHRRISRSSSPRRRRCLWPASGEERRICRVGQRRSPSQSDGSSYSSVSRGVIGEEGEGSRGTRRRGAMQSVTFIILHPPLRRSSRRFNRADVSLRHPFFRDHIICVPPYLPPPAPRLTFATRGFVCSFAHLRIPPLFLPLLPLLFPSFVHPSTPPSRFRPPAFVPPALPPSSSFVPPSLLSFQFTNAPFPSRHSKHDHQEKMVASRRHERLDVRRGLGMHAAHGAELACGGAGEGWWFFPGRFFFSFLGWGAGEGEGSEGAGLDAAYLSSRVAFFFARGGFVL
ncbi:hypothetical protein C8R47DRAFT_741336 [Mycena vitilis]|nr:hypothetical protein C8R47DRAFT_741336 [Mycena vitilis]